MKYTDERLSALWDRVEALEATVTEAGALLEAGDDGAAALARLKSGILETFTSALLCSRETTDAMLDHWLPLIKAGG
jgi:hypothetical protein